MLCDVESAFKTFFVQLTTALGFTGILAIALAVEAFFVFLFVLKTFFSYEMRLGRSMDKINTWLFKNKKLNQSNIKEFNDLVKKGPKRLVYYWQQYILFRESEPTHYLSADNLIEKPLKTSSWSNNIRNLNYITVIWSAICFLLGIAYQAGASGSNLTSSSLMVAFTLPVFTVLIGIIASISLKGKKFTNLDDLYHNYHIFARFLTNACVDLPGYIDYDLLFSPKEIEKGNPQLREYYESRARKAKQEFEDAKKSDVEYVEYNFADAGVDGSLVLERAMRETESFINKKTSTLAKIAHVDAEREALRRNYENVQKDLQRKIQASKENISKLIQQQEATTNRMEVGFLRKQQEQEISKQEQLQSEYDQEETRYAISSEELAQEIDKLRKEMDNTKESVQKAMVAEYQSFYEKVMKSAYNQAEKRVQEEKIALKKECDNNEKELTIVQTQIKRLVDENQTLRARLKEVDAVTEVEADQAAELGDKNSEDQSQAPEGTYDENGNYVYADGSFHDANGLFHDIDGKVYDMNGTLIDEPSKETPEEHAQAEIVDDVTAFGSFIPMNEETAKEAEMIDNQDVKIEPYVAETEETEVNQFNEEAAMAESTVALETEQPEVEAEEVLVKPQSENDSSDTNINTTAEDTKPKGKRGRPKKTVVAEPVPKEPKKRGRPKKEETTSPVVKEKKPVGRPKKVSASQKTQEDNASSVDFKDLEKINQMISDEERKLSKMKMLIDNELDEVIDAGTSSALAEERDKIMQEVAALKEKAESVKKNASSETELAAINKRLEALIQEISDLNR